MADWNCSYGERSSTRWQGGEKQCVPLTCMWWLSRQSAHVEQKCAQGLKPKQVGNEHVLICLCVCMCVCDLGMTSLADAYHCACLAVVFVFGNREEQVCVWCASGAQSDRQSHVVRLSVFSFVLAVCRPLFFISCFPLSPVCVTVHLSDLSSSVPCSVLLPLISLYKAEAKE